KQILALTADYYAEAFAPREFIPGQTSVPVSGRVFDASELQSLVDSSLDFWLTTGRFAAQFEKEFARFFKMRHAILVNSGSSANLLALAALTSPTLKEKALRPGDEVITVATGFPTTVNPIVQNNLIPVFVDVDIPTYDIDTSKLEAALSDKTRAVIAAHTLGNPFNLDAVTAFCKQHNLWLIEDCCDATGATYNGQPVGRFGDIATVSFYPVKQIVVASSDKAYGDQEVLPYDENTPLQGQHPYDVSKSAADLIAATYAKSFDLPVAITRCGNFYGGGDLNWNRIIPGTIRSVTRGQRPVIRSDGEYIRDYFYVEDGAAAYMLLAEQLAARPELKGQAFNFSNEIQVTVREIVEKILRMMDSTLEADIRNEVQNEIRHQYLSAEKARHVLNWKPLFTLDNGLAKTIDWYREFFIHEHKS
ncbi:MAG: aminotransferase class I/II-fold pyridoxal phosphate-dependent enzyme, partial [Chloroflexi bacterium]|nr:aminotransferase class I/II-fold pyridoxal phosphate-dependent enzyme [Chloroflexota bacterium]